MREHLKKKWVKKLNFSSWSFMLLDSTISGFGHILMNMEENYDVED